MPLIAASVATKEATLGDSKGEYEMKSKDLLSQSVSRQVGNGLRDGKDPTIQSQYSASPAIRALVLGFDYNIDPFEDIALFYRMIFDVETAEGVGLDIWGRIVGIGRDIQVEEQDYFGYYGSLLDPFDVSPFYDGEKASNVYSLTDPAYRRLIMWKALANISTADAASLNNLTSILFEGQKVYVLETGIMKIRLVIEDELEPYQRAIFRTYGLFAKGAAVEFEWLEVPTPCFGFEGSDLEPFDQAQFFVGQVLNSQLV